MKNNSLKLLKTLLGWPLALTAIFFIFKFIWPNAKTVLITINHVNCGLLIVSIFLFLNYFLFRTIIWKYILELKGHKFSLKETSYLWSISEIKRFLPGGIWAFLGRTHAFAKNNATKTTVLSSIFIESEAVFIGSLLVSLLGIVFIQKTFLGNFGLIAILFAASAICLVFLLGKFFTKRFPGSIHQTLPSFNFRQNLFIMCLAIFSFIFFSLGTYTSILALFPLPSSETLTFIGLFSFSFFIGYIAIFAPMGLGVREGVIALGLGSFIGGTFAGVASIFTRIILIIAELLFLLLTAIFHKLKKNMLPEISKQVLILGLGIISYIVYFTIASFLRYTNFYTGRFDLGNMDQTVWNTLHGRIFQFTNPDGTNIVSRLSFHADFLLIIISPLYKIWEDPRMLLFLQTSVLALGAVFVYGIARKILQNKPLAVIFGLVYLLNPSLEHSNLYDFHAVTLATTFLLGTWYFFLENRFWPMLIFLLLTGISKEEAWLTVGIFGLYLSYCVKAGHNITLKKLFWFIFSLASFGLFWFLIAYAIPHVRGGQHFALSFYSELGNSPNGIAKTIFFSPWKAIFLIFQQSKLYYLFQLSLPFGFIFLFSPLYLVFALPDLAVNLLSNNSQYYQIYFHYTALITPVLFISSIFGTKNLLRKISSKYIILFLLVTTAISAALYGPLPGSKSHNTDMLTKPQPYAGIIDSFLKDIPRKYSIAASNNLGSHLSHRQKIFTIPIGIDQADVILFLLNDQFAQPSLEAQKNMVANMKNNKKYIEIFKLGDFVVFEKRNLYEIVEPNIPKTKLYPISIPTLQNRDYIGSKVIIGKEEGKNKNFKKYPIYYRSDGLRLSGIMDIPKTLMPKSGFPVVIIDTGSISPTSSVINYNKNAVVNFFASHGFISIKPNYRGHGTSERDVAVSSIPSFSIDVLNLIASVQSIEEADAKNVFLWGNQIGGGITLSVLEIHDQNKNIDVPIKAASVWEPVIDVYRGFEKFQNLFPNQSVPYQKLAHKIGVYHTNPFLWQSISSLYYVDDITTPLQISQGMVDSVIPYQWSIELYNDLLSMNKQTKIILYPTGDYALSDVQDKALQQDLLFFKQHIN